MTISDSYYDTTVSGKSDNDGRGVPKTTTQMKELMTFHPAFDMVGVWGLQRRINNGYPHLRAMQYPRNPYKRAYQRAI